MSSDWTVSALQNVLDISIFSGREETMQVASSLPETITYDRYFARVSLEMKIELAAGTLSAVVLVYAFRDINIQLIILISCP